jgi:hypothetical protein
VKRIVIVTGIVTLLGVTTGLAGAASAVPAPPVPGGDGEQVCVVLAHDAQGHGGSDDLCVDL